MQNHVNNQNYTEEVVIMKNVLMQGTGVYIPSNKVYNEEIDKHFEVLGLNAHNLMEHLGRRKRYFISEGENAITMCMDAINNCVTKNNINLEEIEMLLFCSDTPEYLSPSNALKLVGLLGDQLKNVNIAFDINVHFQILSACHPPQKLLNGIYMPRKNITSFIFEKPIPIAKAITTFKITSHNKIYPYLYIFSSSSVIV